MNFKKLSLVVLDILFIAVIAGYAPTKGAEQMQTAALPVNMAFADGKEIYFVHLEASDEIIAKQLTDMMQSLVF